MAEAAEAVAGLPAGTIRLKWPNDLVIGRRRPAGDVRKLAGVLGETDGLGTADPRAVVGLGINADWAAADFPPDLAGDDDLAARGRRAAGRRRRAAGGVPRAYSRPRVVDLRAGRFDGAAWADRQLTTGRHDPARDAGRARDRPRDRRRPVDRRAHRGRCRRPPAGDRHVLVGEVTHVRLADPIAERV